MKVYKMFNCIVIDIFIGNDVGSLLNKIKINDACVIAFSFDIFCSHCFYDARG